MLKVWHVVLTNNNHLFKLIIKDKDVKQIQYGYQCIGIYYKIMAIS